MTTTENADFKHFPLKRISQYSCAPILFRLVCKKVYRFVEYIPVKCFKKFVQSPHLVNARREGNENPNSSVVAETINMLANSSYGYQIIDRSRHTVLTYLSGEKTHDAINTKLFKHLDHLNDQFIETQLAKVEIEH